MQQNFFYCPDKTFCLIDQNLIDIAKVLLAQQKNFVA